MPALPARSFLVLRPALCISGWQSEASGIAFVADFLDPSFRTPDEVVDFPGFARIGLDPERTADN